MKSKSKLEDIEINQRNLGKLMKGGESLNRRLRDACWNGNITMAMTLLIWVPMLIREMHIK